MTKTLMIFLPYLRQGQIHPLNLYHSSPLPRLLNRTMTDLNVLHTLSNKPRMLRVNTSTKPLRQVQYQASTLQCLIHALYFLEDTCLLCNSILIRLMCSLFNRNSPFPSRYSCIYEEEF